MPFFSKIRKFKDSQINLMELNFVNRGKLKKSTVTFIPQKIQIDGHQIRKIIKMSY